ncbi:hypothetical protein NC99_08700 [Sunxiuqinia dokdonensis]|uniref:Uncharacterized protein n=1 Tax=Sunxiuqinia dokdonensis TaxID=1409788 RepID=A0A0L8VD99_9BACT|nr:hypothetical protein NC99_08700 [Sunxiuqinia dokdonensis]
MQFFFSCFSGLGLMTSSLSLFLCVSRISLFKYGEMGILSYTQMTIIDQE